MTALMGASGAGKTTLLDVLGGRKTSGTVQGDIYVNGHIVDMKTFRRYSAYCEQVDIHDALPTVREGLRFSAKMVRSRHSLSMLSMLFVMPRRGLLLSCLL
jgi:ABC-type multidrug transport system ATPase subunit